MEDREGAVCHKFFRDLDRPPIPCQKVYYTSPSYLGKQANNIVQSFAALWLYDLMPCLTFRAVRVLGKPTPSRVLLGDSAVLGSIFRLGLELSLYCVAKKNIILLKITILY